MDKWLKPILDPALVGVSSWRGSEPVHDDELFLGMESDGKVSKGRLKPTLTNLALPGALVDLVKSKCRSFALLRMTTFGWERFELSPKVACDRCQFERSVFDCGFFAQARFRL